jgi:hypothetical protein
MIKMINVLSNQMKEFEYDLNELQKLFVPLNERNDKIILDELEKLVNKYPSHPRVVLEMVLFLLLCNDDNLVNQYEFSDIKGLLLQSCKLFGKDIDLNIEYFFFIKNIENDDEAAILYLDSFRKKIADEVNKE